MDKKERKYYEKKYRHLNLYFDHGKGWDHLTLAAARDLDSYWPKWMPFWLKHLWVNSIGKGYRLTNFGVFLTKLKLDFLVNTPNKFLQIKEKFGELRLYTSGNHSKVISALESISYQTCENCGSMSQIGHTSGWIFTLCKECVTNSDKTLSNWKPDKNG